MNELDKAVAAANRIKRNHEEFHRIMYPHSDKDKIWREATDHDCVMARFILDNLYSLEKLRKEADLNSPLLTPEFMALTLGGIVKSCEDF